MKFGKKIKVVMWKSYTIRKRFWILSLIEILIPLIFYIIIPCFYSLYNLPETIEEKYGTRRSSQDIYNLFDKQYAIAYYPKRPRFTAIMRNVKKLLTPIDVQGFKDKPLLRRYINNKQKATNSKVVSVIFIKTDDEIMHYKIRSLQYVNWTTRTTKYRSGYARPDMGSYNYLHFNFLPLQMAVSISYLQKMSNISAEFVIEEMPHPHYTIEIPDSFKGIYSILTILSFLFSYLNFVQRIVEEKDSDIKDLIKTTRLEPWMLQVGWFLHVLTVIAMSTFLIVIILKAPLYNSLPVLKYSDPGLLFLFLCFYNVAAVSFFFAISSFFYKPLSASLVGLITWISSYLLILTLIDTYPAVIVPTKIICSLLPTIALTFGYEIIKAFETRKVGIQWNNLFEASMGRKEEFTMFITFIVLIFDSILYIAIAVCVERILPDRYGTTKSFNFLCTNHCKKLHSRKKKSEDTLRSFLSDNKIEQEVDFPVGIRIKNLYKIFRNVTAVNNLSLDIYRGQITGLLGHNGAGKSSTISVMSGMSAASSGTIEIFGYDVKHNLHKIKRLLGVCPQNNLLFSELSVIEQLSFFGMLKGLSARKAFQDASHLLQRLNLYDQRNFLKSMLSTSMERTLAIAIAIIGDPQVLLLDEPTVGLDTEACRIVWDILLSLRKSRVIFIVTQNMEEADILVDRIAVMRYGQIICYGTPTYLSKKFEIDYQFAVTFDKRQDNTDVRKEVTSVIKSSVPLAILNTSAGENLTFSLSYNSKKHFSAILAFLEAYKSNFNIVSMKLSVAFMSDIYIRLFCVTVYHATTLFFRINDIISKGLTTSLEDQEIPQRYGDIFLNEVGGYRKIILQFKALLMKKYWAEKKKMCSFLFLVLLTIIGTSLVLYCVDTYKSKDGYVLLPNVYDKSSMLYSVLKDDYQLQDFAMAYKNQVSTVVDEIREVTNIRESILEEGKKNIVFYSTYFMIGVEFNKTFDDKILITCFYSPNSIHGAPISFGMAINSVLTSLFNLSIVVESKPYHSFCGFQCAEDETTFYPYSIFVFELLLLPGYFLYLPVTEKISKIKHLQLMTGVPITLYWLAFYVWDLMLLIVINVGIIFVVLRTKLNYDLSLCCRTNNGLYVMFLILMGYSCGIISYSYLCSFMCKQTKHISQFLVSNLILGLTLATFVVSMKRITGDTVIYDLLNLLPQYGLCMSIYYYNKHIKYLRIQALKVSNLREQNTVSYLYGEWGVHLNISIMFFSAFLYFTILILLEKRVFSKLCQAISKNVSKTRRIDFEDEDENVKKENRRISNIFQEEETQVNKSNSATDLFLAHKITKSIKNVQVIKGVSFGVKERECFALLGANGSGKTTIFRMLSGELPLSNGEACINFNKTYYRLSNQLKQYSKMIGYCPQTDSVISGLSGQEMLYIFGRMRGIGEGLHDLVDAWLLRLGLSDISNHYCENYSKGDKRKLSIGIALIGSPLVLMLDQPTDGVNPESCQELWNMLRSSFNRKDGKSCVIIATQKPDECDELCSSVAILKFGRVRFYRKRDNFTNEDTQGFTVKLKINLNFDSTPSDTKEYNNLDDSTDDDNLRNLMADVSLTFKDSFILEEKHITLLQYYVRGDTKKWCDIYEDVDHLQLRHPMIEGYVITEEEPFLLVLRKNL